jgi:hypothetical protein
VSRGALIGLGVLALAGFWLASKKTSKPSEPETPGPEDLDPQTPPDDDPGEIGSDTAPDTGGPVTPVNTIGKPIVVGEASDPNVAPYLASLATTFINHGVNIQRVSPFALTVMTKAPLTDGPDPGSDKSRPVAIPPTEMWEGLATVAGIVSQVISQIVINGEHLVWRVTGYRPKDYNAAVGGAPKSRHIYGDAIDVWLPTSLIANGSATQKTEARERLRMAFARYIVAHQNTSGLGFGFGVYTNDIHIDIGRKKGTIVTWEQGAKYINKARAELGVA